MRRKRSAGKPKKTYTLTSDAVAIIEQERKARGLRSASSALKALLKDVRCDNIEDVAASISNY
jgi:hypothetical protein